MAKIQKGFGWQLTVIIAVLPILLAIKFNSGPQPQSLAAVINNLGKLAGLSGFVLLAWNIILSARIPILERAFVGLDALYRAHHIIGGVSFILLLIHPALITINYALTSYPAAFDFLTSTNNIALFVGRSALITLTIIMIFTFFIKLKHETFVILHRLLGIVLVLGALHGILIKSDLSTNLPLAIYVYCVSAVALGLYIYRSIFHRSLTAKRTYTISDVRRLDNITEITLSNTNGHFSHYPGQFAFLTIIDSSLPTQTHPFTIASAPSEPNLRFAIKKLGDYTTLMPSINIGATVKVEAPYGRFSYQLMDKHKQIWIAGGIGITPFLSMARSLAESRTNVQIHLYYCVKTQSEAVFASELQAIAKKSQNFHVFVFAAETDGMLTAKLLKDKFVDLSTSYDILICGPPAMMRGLRKELVGLDVKKKNIHTEEFSLS